MRKLLFIITILLPTFAAAQTPVTFRECLEKGLERNYDIRIMRNSERISDNNATLGNAGFLPAADISAGYSGTLNDTKQYVRDASNIVTNNGVNNQGVNAGVNLNWNVFNGFSVQTSYKRLQELQQMGELATRLQIESFISGFAAEYYNYIRQTIRLKNLEYAVQLSEERVRIVSVSAEIGSLSKFDLQQAKVDLNSDKSRLIKQHEVLHTLRTQLNEMIAVTNVEQELSLADTTIVFNPDLMRDGLWESTLVNNIYLKIARKQGDISKLDLKSIQSRNYPYLRLNAGYGYGGNWFGTGTYDRQKTLGANYGLSLGFTLFDGLNQRRAQRNARIEIQNRELEYEQTELSLDVDLSNAWMAYQNNIRLLDLERSNLATARDNYDIAIYRYKMYQLSGVELREAQNSLLEAEERLVQVMYDTKLCEISLLQIAGMIVLYLE